MKLLAFNIRHGRGMDGLVNLNRIAQVIEESQADVVALTEVDRHFSRRSSYEDQLRRLADRLDMNGVFGAALTYWSFSRRKAKAAQYGNAILSRFPIEAHYNHLLNPYPLTLERRALLEARLRVNEREVTVYCTHLSLLPYYQIKQAGQLLSCIRKCNNPLVLMGDFNARPQSRLWKSLTRHLIDASQAAPVNSCRTFPSLKPAVQLDYIWMNPAWHIHSVSSWNSCPEASDHLPLLAEATLMDIGSP
ncbi:endonuclease/exonuclease/phosphatase family protein [Paenibacillus senegalensis]|uniref:endonuclease/exonuclease/phosphatase family protein n=1 Tax=Paenibacillus senegalensis TaxID=1465766 RepID=UPI000287FCA1|nr:endonuclease/exonuclease/phosphatase family protein [Paenibacillus senegalensis]